MEIQIYNVAEALNFLLSDNEGKYLQLPWLKWSHEVKFKFMVIALSNSTKTKSCAKRKLRQVRIISLLKYVNLNPFDEQVSPKVGAINKWIWTISLLTHHSGIIKWFQFWVLAKSPWTIYSNIKLYIYCLHLIVEPQLSSCMLLYRSNLSKYKYVLYSGDNFLPFIPNGLNLFPFINFQYYGWMAFAKDHITNREE